MRFTPKKEHRVAVSPLQARYVEDDYIAVPNEVILRSMPPAEELKKIQATLTPNAFEFEVMDAHAEAEDVLKITKLEEQQARPLREATLGVHGAAEKLKEIDGKISTLRDRITFRRAERAARRNGAPAKRN